MSQVRSISENILAMLRSRQSHIDTIDDSQEAYWRVTRKVSRVPDERDDDNLSLLALKCVNSPQSYLSAVISKVKK